MSPSAGQPPFDEYAANLFKGLAHPFRVRILALLAAMQQHDALRPPESATETGELSVALLLRETGLEASHLSQHLAVLRRHRLVESTRRGSHVYYRLAHARLADVLAVAGSVLQDTLPADEWLRAHTDDGVSRTESPARSSEDGGRP